MLEEVLEEVQSFELVPSNSSILREPTVKFDMDNPPIDPAILAQRMLKTMNEKRGIGLAANQCGLPYRVLAIKGDPNYICFNPKIVSSSDETTLLEEACLSFPGVYVKIKRPAAIRVRFQVLSGKTVTKSFTGLTARIFQHEMDHLDGILFYNRANRFHRDSALRKAAKIKKS